MEFVIEVSIDTSHRDFIKALEKKVRAVVKRQEQCNNQSASPYTRIYLQQEREELEQLILEYLTLET